MHVTGTFTNPSDAVIKTNVQSLNNNVAQQLQQLQPISFQYTNTAVPQLFNNNGNNIFGTMWNIHIYTITNGVNRMKLNGTISYTIKGFTGQQKTYLITFK